MPTTGCSSTRTPSCAVGQNGEIFALIRSGLEKGNRTREVIDVCGNLEAIRQALAALRPGELLVIQPEIPTFGAEYFTRLIRRGRARSISNRRVPASGRGLTFIELPGSPVGGRPTRLSRLRLSQTMGIAKLRNSGRRQGGSDGISENLGLAGG